MVAAALVAALGAASCGDGTHRRSDSRASGRARDAAARLSLARQVGELVVVSFPGRSVPTDILRRGQATGAILFGGNIGSPAALRRLTAALKRAAHGRALVMTDQEGGGVRIVRFAGPPSGQPAVRSRDRAGTEALAAGRRLRALGINVNLAPVLDVAEPGSALRGRAFRGGAASVGALGAAAVAAYDRARVAATVKHFPGLGAASSNTDRRRVTIRRGRARLLSSDVAPFAQGVRAGAPLVMASHALYPAFDRSRIASQSPAILGGLLRERLGFTGAVITDSLEARAVLARSTVATAAARSLAAGADLVLLTGPGSYPHVYRRLLREARRSPAFRARLRTARARVQSTIAR